MLAVTKLAQWQREHKLRIIALSCTPLTLPWQLELLGPKCREIKFDPYDDEEIVHIVRARIDDQRILSDDTIKQAISKANRNSTSNVKSILDILRKASHIAVWQHHQIRSEGSSTTQAPVETVGHLVSAIQLSQQWRDVRFESAYRTVLTLVQRGLLLAVNTERGHGMEVKLGVAPQAVEEMLRTRPRDIPLW
ncbi:hypothetical protein ABBQ38_005848 [Trebouxia sp. C0009 RCD-2024]